MSKRRIGLKPLMWTVLLVPLVVGSAYALNDRSADFTETMHIGDSYSTKVLSILRQPFSDTMIIGDSYSTKLLSAVLQSSTESITINDSYSTKIIPATSRALYDDFDDNDMDVSKWISESSGSDTKIDETNKRAEIFHSASASGSVFYSQYKSTCRLKGDFDIQVDYKLLEWPSANGIRVGLAIQDKSPSGGVVERVSVSENDFTTPIETYLTDFGGEIRGLERTKDLSGTLRLVRSGNTMTGYSGSSTIGSGSVTNSDVSFIIASWGHDDSFADKDVKVAFDNMKINKGITVGCD